MRVLRMCGVQLGVLLALLAIGSRLGGQTPAVVGSSDTFNDSNFHLTNYVQQGIDIHQLLQIMGKRVRRSTLFGMPLQQQCYYSFTDAYIASVYRALSRDEQARFDPMITGFNPADMYAVDHIRRVLETFPGVFTGIGEFSASFTNPALDRILDFAGEVGLVVLIHDDVGTEPVYLTQMEALLMRHPETRIIWVVQGQLAIVESMLTEPALSHLNFDISPDSIARVSTILNKYPDRFLFGTDSIAPAGPAPYFAMFDMWAPIWQQLTPEASLAIRKGNYERIFDEGRRKVRAWEQANVRGAQPISETRSE